VNVGLNGVDVRAGTRTTNKSKEAIVARMQDLLMSNSLTMHRRFLVPHPEQQPPGEETVEASRKLFVDELANMQMEFCRPTGPVASQHQRGHIKYRGFRADGHRANDDKFMALGFCLQCYPLYMANPRLFVRVVVPQLGSISF
jgi:hypothetical protein